MRPRRSQRHMQLKSTFFGGISAVGVLFQIGSLLIGGISFFAIDHFQSGATAKDLATATENLRVISVELPVITQRLSRVESQVAQDEAERRRGIEISDAWKLQVTADMATLLDRTKSR